MTKTQTAAAALPPPTQYAADDADWTSQKRTDNRRVARLWKIGKFEWEMTPAARRREQALRAARQAKCAHVIGGDHHCRLTREEMTAPLAWHEEQMARVHRYGVLADGSVGWAVIK